MKYGFRKIQFYLENPESTLFPMFAKTSGEQVCAEK
jgi:hypothetical protein